MTLSMDRLRILEVLLRTRSPTLAAHELGLTQSAASKALKQLRKETGDPLLLRHGDAMVLTPRAERMLPALSASLHALQTLLEADGQTGRPAQATIAMRDQFSSVLTAPLSRLLQAQAPNTILNIVPYDRSRIAEELLSGAADLAVAVEPPAAPSLMVSTLYREDFLCLTSSPEPPSLEDYLKAQHVVTSSHAGFRGVDAVLTEIGASRRIAVRVPYFTGAIEIAEQEGCFLTLPASLARRRAGRLFVHPLPFAMDGFAVSMTWDRRYNEDPNHRWLRELLREAAKMR